MRYTLVNSAHTWGYAKPAENGYSKPVLYPRSPGWDPVLQVDPYLKVLYSRSPGRDPVLKMDRLTRMKGTRVNGPILKRRVIFPIAGKGPCFYRLTRVKSVIYSRSPGWDPVLKVDRLTRVKGTLFYRLTRIKSVIYSRSPGRDPVLKVDRLTRVKKCYIFPIAGKGPCTKDGQVDPY